MATTPSFNWPTPDNTGLVKNGALDIRTLGNSIDSSMTDLKGGTTGQILAKATDTDMDFTWVTNDVGDITAVTAGTGISGGGTSGAVTITNSMATEITAKGDLIVGTGSATFDNLAAGSNGDTIVADSSTSTGLRYQSNFSAGKNAILNGAYDCFQRGTSVNLTTSVATFLADRYQVSCNFSAGTATLTQQTFTPGTAPVAGYEGTYFQRVTAGSTSSYIDWTQKIENVRTMAGQTITFSFWAKASTSTNVTMLVRQNFGSGGSANVDTSAAITLTTSWARYTFTVAPLGSMSGKTIGANSYLMVGFYSTAGVTGSQTIDSWGWQVEASAVATAFQTATGTIQGELAACQRYYYEMAYSGAEPYGSGAATNTTSAVISTALPVFMRVVPTAVYTGTFRIEGGAQKTGIAAASLSLNQVQNQQILTNVTSSSLTAGWAFVMLANGASAIKLSAEL